MTPLGELLRNQTRTGVLRTLALDDVPLGVRALAAFAKTHPYTTLKTLQELQAQGLVDKTGPDSRPAYRIRQAHPEAVRLQLLFETDRQTVLQNEQKDLTRRAREFSTFTRQALNTLQRARESLHETV